MNEYNLKLIKNLIKCYAAGFVFSLIFAVIVQLLPYGIGTPITDIFQLNLTIFGLIFSNLIYLFKYL